VALLTTRISENFYVLNNCADLLSEFPMNDFNKQNLLDQLVSSDSSIQQGSAAYDLAKSEDPALVNMLLLHLENLDEGARGNAVEMAVDGLLASNSCNLEPLLSCLQNSPASVAGKNSAYMLGEIAYRQGLKRDPAIVPALLQALSENLDLGIGAIANCIHAVRECARAGPIPEANSLMTSVLVAADRPQPQFNIWYLTLALEVLAINHVSSDQDFSAELQKQLQLLLPSSKAYKELQAWLLESQSNLDR
jgi:hypothetical protein